MTTVPTRKQVKTALKKAQDAPKAVSKEDRHRYALVKDRAKKLEQENNDAVILFPAADAPWYKMGNFSALVYVFDLGLRMGKAPKIQIDNDKGTTIFDWVAFIHNLEIFKNAMAEIGYKEVEEIGDGIVRFPLGKTYTKSEIKQLYAQVQNVLDDVRKMAKVEIVYPKVYTQLMKVMTIYYAKVKRMNSVTREMLGLRLWENLLRINAVYHAIARGKISSQSGLNEIGSLLDAIIDADMAAANIGVWDPQTAVKMTKMVVELQELVSAEKKKLAKASAI